MPTPNLLITHIVQSQAQKEVTANTAFDQLEKNMTEELALAVGGGAGDTTMTDAEMRNAVYRLTGALTGNRNLVVPTRDKLYVIHNTTTGAFTLTVKTSGGSGVIVEQGSKAVVYCDGTNVIELSGHPAAFRTLTGTLTVRITDRICFCDATGGNVVITLPAASTAQGRELLFIRVDTSANTVTINRAGADDINNATTSKTITNVIGTALRLVGFSASRWHAQTLTAA